MTVVVLANWAAVPILLYIILSDLRLMRIPNFAVLALLVVFAATQAPFLSIEVLLWRVAVAGVALALGVALFARRLLGGGDVKLLPVVLLFVPIDDLAAFCLALSVSAVVTLSVIKMARAWPVAARFGWRSISQQRRLPLGPAIALALLIYRPLGAFALTLLRGAQT